MVFKILISLLVLKAYQVKVSNLKLHPPLLRFVSLASLDDFARDPAHCITYSPFGLVETGGTLATKAPPIAKGKTEAELDPRIRAGLKKAKAMSKRHTEKGVVVRVVKGRLKRLPTKAYAMYVEALKIPVPA